MKKLILNTLLGTIVPLACFAGGGSPGGGAGICMTGQCLTLAQAGVRLAPESIGPRGEAIGWVMPPSLLKEIVGVSKLLPFGETQLKTQTVGSYGTFLKVNSVSQDVLQKIRSAYEDVLRETHSGQLSKDLEIFAISNEKNTFLLPPFFDLSSFQQALILFHEGIVRTHAQDYRLALKFDGYLLDYLNRRSHPNYSPLRFYKLLEAISSDRSSNYRLTIKYVESKIGRKIGIKDLEGSYERMSELQSQLPEYVAIFRGIKGNLDANMSMDGGLSPVRVGAVQRACRNWNQDENGDVRVTEYSPWSMLFVNCEAFREFIKAEPQPSDSPLLCYSGRGSFCSYQRAEIQEMNVGIIY